eukprot:4566230-Pyramimonas_sp.AAC.1
MGAVGSLFRGREGSRRSRHYLPKENPVIEGRSSALIADRLLEGRSEGGPRGVQGRSEGGSLVK